MIWKYHLWGGKGRAQILILFKNHRFVIQILKICSLVFQSRILYFLHLETFSFFIFEESTFVISLAKFGGFLQRATNGSLEILHLVAHCNKSLSIHLRISTSP